MSKYNEHATTPEGRAKTRAWIKHMCPLVWVFSPSKVGKTTLLGTLMRHQDYHPVHFIDGDVGSETIGPMLRDKHVCTHVKFDRDPSELTDWFVSKLIEARKVKCSAIIIEGISAHHQACVAREVERLTYESGGKAPTGEALWGAHRPAATQSGTLIQQIEWIKQARIAANISVPIFVTENTKERMRKNQSTIYVPDWSNNCIERSMRTMDAHLQLSRSPNGTQIYAVADEDHPYAAMRNATAAKKVQRQRNLTLPGLLTLWATTIDEDTAKFQEKVDKMYPTTAEATNAEKTQENAT